MNIENHEFMPWPKMARLSRECIITEKLDGTNACVNIVLAREIPNGGQSLATAAVTVSPDATFYIFAGSRTRWIQPGNDNYGFAAWVLANCEELVKLGPGRHFGEWWGNGIQRRYNMTQKRFSLFNAKRWMPDAATELAAEWGRVCNKVVDADGNKCGCVSVVPVLYHGEFSTNMVERCMNQLRLVGSVAAPGFRQPEGIIVYHVAGKVAFKKTLDGDAAKGPDYALLQKCSDSLTKTFTRP